MPQDHVPIVNLVRTERPLAIKVCEPRLGGLEQVLVEVEGLSKPTVRECQSECLGGTECWLGNKGPASSYRVEVVFST